MIAGGGCLAVRGNITVVFLLTRAAELIVTAKTNNVRQETPRAKPSSAPPANAPIVPEVRVDLPKSGPVDPTPTPVTPTPAPMPSPPPVQPMPVPPMPVAPPAPRIDPEYGVRLRTSNESFRLKTTAATADDKTLVTMAGNVLTVWELPTGKLKTRIVLPMPKQTFRNDVFGGAISSDGKTFAYLMNEKLTTLDLESKTFETYPNQPQIRYPHAPVFLEGDDKIWAISSRQRGQTGLPMNEWSVRDRKWTGLISAFSAPRFEKLEFGAFCAPKNLMAFYDANDRTVLLFDVAAGNFIDLWKPPPLGDGQKARAEHFRFSPEGRYLFFETRADKDPALGEAVLFDVDKRTRVAGLPFDIKPNVVRQVGFSADENRLIFANDKGSFFLYDVPASRLLGVFHPKQFQAETQVPAPIFTRDGKTLILSSSNVVLLLDFPALPLKGS
jgi:WD40 repeat protein